MIDFAIPLLRAAALVHESHFPLLNHLSELSVALTLGAASLTKTEECCVFSCSETGGCWGAEYCPDGNCTNGGLGGVFPPLRGGCGSGGGPGGPPRRGPWGGVRGVPPPPAGRLFFFPCGPW